MNQGEITLEGLGEVKKALKKLYPELREEAMKGLAKAGMNIIADAQVNLRNNTSVVTGLLRASGRVQRVNARPSVIGRVVNWFKSKLGKTVVNEDELEVGFFDTSEKSQGYAYYVEYGRRAGRMPPPDELAQWFRKKHRLSDEDARQAGWAMAVRIAREGTQPHPFFGPAVEKNKGRIESVVRDVVKKLIDNPGKR